MQYILLMSEKALFSSSDVLRLHYKMLEEDLALNP